MKYGLEFPDRERSVKITIAKFYAMSIWSQSTCFASSDFRLAIQYSGEPDFESASELSAPFGGWSDARVGVEFQWKSNAIFQGVWNTSILRNGKNISTCGKWSPVCEVSEPTHQYLELESRLDGGLRIQRHFFLSHEEELMILADSILPTAHEFEKNERKKRVPPQSQIQYEMRIPLAPGILGGPGEPNATERILRKTKSAKKTLARIFPLALPQENQEENLESATGDFGFETDDTTSVMVLRYRGVGNALFVPLFFDLSESRERVSHLWTKLTVGENREAVPLDRAAGYRIQTQGKQYLLYRSLTPQRNRTILGVNLVSDLFFASFCPEKGAEMILELNEE